MEESRTEHDENKLDDEIKMNEIQGDKIQVNGIQANETCNLNDGGSPSKSQDADLEDEEELSRLKALATDVREQVDLERDVGRRVCYTIDFMYSTYLNGLIGGAVTYRASQ